MSVPVLTTATEKGSALNVQEFDTNWTNIELAFADVLAKDLAHDQRLDALEAVRDSLKEWANWKLFAETELELLLAGRVTGVEGDWEVIAQGVSTISSSWIGYGLVASKGRGVVQVAIPENASINSGTAKLDEKIRAKIRGASGVVYECPMIYSGTYQTVFCVDPRRDIATTLNDFSLGSPIQWWVEQENTTNQGRGTRNRTEYFLGESQSTTAKIEAILGGLLPRPGVITTGYWEHDNWISTQGDGVRTDFRCHRPTTDAPSEVRRWNGTTWTVETGWNWSSNTYTLTLSTPLSSSEALAVDCTHYARALRPDHSRRILAGSPFVVAANGCNLNSAAFIVWEMTGVCPVGAPTNYKRHAILLNEVIDRYTSFRGLTHYTLTMNSVNSGGAKMWAWFTELDNGNIGIQLANREIIHNGIDWGDDGQIITSLNGVTLTADDNGKTIREAVHTYDTGKPINI